MSLPVFPSLDLPSRTAGDSLGAMRAGKWLGILQFLIGIGAVPAGFGLVMDPSGSAVGFDLQWLEGSPFSDFLIPGLVLMTVNGLGHLVGCFASFRGWRRAGELGLALGVFLTLWILLQVYWIGLGSWLQPAYFIIGLLECGLAIAVLSSSTDARVLHHSDTENTTS